MGRLWLTVPERIASDERFRQAVKEGKTIRELHELVGAQLFGRTSVKRARRLVMGGPARPPEGHPSVARNKEAAKLEAVQPPFPFPAEPSKRSPLAGIIADSVAIKAGNITKVPSSLSVRLMSAPNGIMTCRIAVHQGMAEADSGIVITAPPGVTIQFESLHPSS